MPEIFASDPTISVQKTAQGQGSPFIRGFTGFRILLLIDGIRLKNSVFRDGPNEYWNTVDSFIIGRLEVVKGPASALYGSDAVGGTVNAITINPGKESGAGGRALQRSASADRSNISRAELDAALSSNLRLRLGISAKDFNELKAGAQIGLQPKTGYREEDYDLKAEYRINPSDQLILAHQSVNQPDVWRTHATVYGISWENTDTGTDKSRFYNHQRRLTYIQYRRADSGFLGQQAQFSLSYHSQDEQLFRRRGNDKTERSGFAVDTIGLSAQLEHPLSSGRIVYGAEFYRDRVNSFARKYLANGALESFEIQGPVADDAFYGLAGLFAQAEYSLQPSLNLTAGIRYNSASVDADKVKDPAVSTPTQIALSDRWDRFCGNLRLSYLPTPEWNIFGGISQGFRAPNLSDLSRLDIALSNEIETPSPGLNPENYISYEAGLKKKSGRLSLQGAFFYTLINDMIIRYPTGTTINGLNEVQKANAGDGCIYGAEVHGSYGLNQCWSLFGGAGSQRGAVDTYTGPGTKSRQPVSKMPPPMLQMGIRRADTSGKWRLELEAKAAGRQDRLSPLDKLDIQRIPPGGTPGYLIYNFRAGLDLGRGFRTGLGLENIGNRDYRVHGSGNNESGRNLILTLEARF